MSDHPHPDWRSQDDREIGRSRGRIVDPGTVIRDDLCFLGAWNCVAIVEIANFSILRRHFGLSRADHLAAEVATRIGQLVSQSTVSVVAPDRIRLRFTGSGRDRLDAMLATIAAAFDKPVELLGEICPIELTLGGARCEPGECCEIKLIEEAESAVREARDEHVPVARDVTRGGDAIDRILLARDIAVAIDENQLLLEYQPKVHLRQQEVRSVEALVRWRHPLRGMIPPGEFIPVAEESRAIVALTLWTLRQAITDQKAFAAAGHDVTVFVNISGVLLADPTFVRAACRLVEESGARIGFEITETAVIRDPDGAIANLKAFAAIGVTLSIDDYGAGLSSLAYLKQLPARELKIDKLFITKLTSSNRDPLIVRSTIDLAHALDMEVVAEGVETLGALALLSVMGCDMAQGFLISRPIAPKALIVFLDGQRHRELIQNMTSPFRLVRGAAKNG